MSRVFPYYHFDFFSALVPFLLYMEIISTYILLFCVLCLLGLEALGSITQYSKMMLSFGLSLQYKY